MCKARGIITRCFVRRREDVTGGLSQPLHSRVLFSFLVMLKSLSYINFPAVTDRAAHLHFKPGKHSRHHRSMQLCMATTNRVYMR